MRLFEKNGGEYIAKNIKNILNNLKKKKLDEYDIKIMELLWYLQAINNKYTKIYDLINYLKYSGNNRKINELAAELEESLVIDLSQKLRDKLSRKPNWNRSEIYDIFNEIVIEVRDDRRKLSDT